MRGFNISEGFIWNQIGVTHDSGTKRQFSWTLLSYCSIFFLGFIIIFQDSLFMQHVLCSKFRYV